MSAVSYVLETLDRVRQIEARAPGPTRRELQRTYLKLQAKYKLRRVLPAGSLRGEFICGFHLESPEYGTLAFLFEEIFLRRDYEFTAATDRPLILDCGSNIGMSLAYFKRLYPQSRVVGFEACKESFEVLSRNVAANRMDGVKLHNVALHGAEGPVEFFVSPMHPTSLTNSSSAGQVAGTARIVQGMPLSKFITGPVDFLKMDIEGAEAVVLAELAASGRMRSIREMVVEYHHHADRSEDRLSRTLRLLEDNGFGYQIRSIPWQAFTRETFQDLLIRAYQK